VAGIRDQVLDIFRTKKPDPKPAREYEIVLTYPFERGVFSSPTYRNLAIEGVRSNGAVAPCVTEHLFAYPEPPLVAMKRAPAGSIPLPSSPITKLLQRPNEQLSGRALRAYISLFKSVSGSCYLWKSRSSSGRVVELWPLSDAQIRPIGGTDRLTERYEFTGPNGQPEPVPEDDIIHLKWMPDPLYPWRGLGPMQSCLREIDTDNEATRMVFDLLKNDCMPRNALVIPAGAPELSDEQRKRLKEETAEKIGGRNKGKLLLMEGGMDIKRLSLDLREMETKALRAIPEARICAAFRVSPMLIGLNVGMDASTFNNYEEARKSFSANTCVPMWANDSDEITEGLVYEFTDDPDVIIGFDISQVASLSFLVEQKREMALKGLTAGAWLVNEYRAACGLPADDGGNIYLRGLAMQEVQAQIPGVKQPKEKPKARAPYETKAVQNAKALGAALKAFREVAIRKAVPEYEAYFQALGARVVERVERGAKSSKAGEPPITPKDVAELAAISKRQTVNLLKVSWEAWNSVLGITKVFDLNDPACVAALKWIGEDVQDISDKTLEKIRTALSEGYDRGWSIDQIVRGDADFDIRGLRDIVEETYEGRAENIARTELGTAQNMTSLGRYTAAGVKEVFVLDGDGPNSCEECIPLYGQIWPIAKAEAQPLQHPKCVRSYAPIVEA
jgi:HK97 family phage portal protein